LAKAFDKVKDSSNVKIKKFEKNPVQKAMEAQGKA
jgi:hypothetical protein